MLSLICAAIKALGLIDDVEQWIAKLRAEQQGKQEQVAADNAVALQGDRVAARTADSVLATPDDQLDERLRKSFGGPVQ